MAFSLMVLMASAIEGHQNQNGANNDRNIHIKGCGISKRSYLERAINEFSTSYGYFPRLSGGGATKGIRLAALGTVDIGATCRHQLIDILGDVHEDETGVELIQVGWDALVVIVNQNNPVNDIALDELKKVFSGGIRSWKDLGGADKEIHTLIRKDKNSGVGYMSRLLMFENVNFKFKETVFEYDSTIPLENNVIRREDAIAIDGISSAKKLPLKILSLDGVYPGKANIASGTYPYYRPLYLAVSKNGKTPKVEQFLEFILGPEGQRIISEEGSINLSEGKLLFDLWDKRPK